MKNNKLFLITSFIEGGTLLATELISAKAVAPYYGTSIVVWALVLSITLLGLAIGYYLGGKYTVNEFSNKPLLIVFGAAIVLNLISPFLSKAIMQMLINFDLGIAVFISLLIFLAPLMIVYGMISPMIVGKLQLFNTTQNNVGLVFSVSTFGGVLFCFLYGLYVIPFWGLNEAYFLNAVLLLFCLPIFVFGKTTTIKN
ncbi:MAG: fused MFS/spermidine synthase [Bacteroidota bacterium]